MLFDPPPRFCGLPAEGFDAFAETDRDQRRLQIIAAFHPPLQALGEDLVDGLAGIAAAPLHWHLPRLDWPRGYQPFCTWLALSRDAHGYQAGPQLNLGVHADHVALRLGWDVSADAFGRFEFLCRHGELGEQLVQTARASAFQFRVYATAPWPLGSQLVFESPEDLAESFAVTRRSGVWWELGERLELPGRMGLVTSPALGTEALERFRALLPAYDRIAGAEGSSPPVES